MELALSTRKTRALLAFGALCAGFVNGFCGTGGGIVLWFVLGALSASDVKERLILSSAAVWFFCAVSLFFYAPAAQLSLADLLSVGIPAALGGILGAFLQRRIPTHALRALFGILMMVGGILMLVR